MRSISELILATKIGLFIPKLLGGFPKKSRVEGVINA